MLVRDLTVCFIFMVQIFCIFFELCKYHKICVPSLMIHLCPMFDDTFRIAKNDQF